jgi:hypothetical protein
MAEGTVWRMLPVSEHDGVRLLILDELRSACPRLTATAGQYMAEAAAICLDDQGHHEETLLQADGTYTATYLLR